MPTIYEETVSTPLYFSQKCEVYTQAINPYYGTLPSAETYFRGRIRASVTDWIDADDADKVAALAHATRIVEALNLMGTSVSETQELHFPTEEYGTPDEILIAVYEIAAKLLSGIDPDTEADNLSVTSQGYAGGRTSYDRSFVPDHIRSGVPSAFAWSILRPYLHDPLRLKVRRG